MGGWTECCLSTAWHLEMDGGTEWMNAVIESYLHQFTLYKQDDSDHLLPMTALHIGIQPADTTNVSPFFLTHGWDMNVLDLFEEPTKRPKSEDSPITCGEQIIQKLKSTVELAQASMATAQELYEHYTNS